MNKTITEKELAINLYNYYSKHMSTSEKENISRIVNSLNSFNKIENSSFDYWIKYKKIIDIIFDNFGDKRLCLELINDQIVRHQSYKDDYNKIVNLISSYIAICALFISISKDIEKNGLWIGIFGFAMLITTFSIFKFYGSLQDNYMINILTEKYNQIREEIKAKE